MAGSNGPFVRANHEGYGNWYWCRKFAPKQPESFTTKNLGVPFPMEEPPVVATPMLRLPGGPFRLAFPALLGTP